MKLDFIPLGKLVVSATNMRHGKRPPDVSDILPSIRRRGVLQPVIVRPSASPATDGDGGFEIIAGRRRFTAACIVAAECNVAGGEAAPAMPSCPARSSIAATMPTRSRLR